MNELNEKIWELRDKIEELEHQIEDLERQNSNWYIGVYTIGDGDYWDEFYCQIGYMTEDRAKDWAEYRASNEDIYEARYFAVTEEVYKKYGSWRNLDELSKSINMYDPVVRNLKGVVSFRDDVNQAINDLAKELGIKYLGFMHPAN